MEEEDYNDEEDVDQKNNKPNKRYSPDNADLEKVDYISFIQDFEKKWSGQKKMKGPYRLYKIRK
jgi:hypothetical protein